MILDTVVQVGHGVAEVPRGDECADLGLSELSSLFVCSSTLLQRLQCPRAEAGRLDQHVLCFEQCQTGDGSPLGACRPQMSWPPG